jgi:N-methylhydantoinase B
MTKPTFNPIELEVYRQLLASVAEEMGVRLMRSAYSPNIKERRDFSCALFDAAGDMIAQAAHIPVHLGSSPASVKAVIETFGDDMRPGDRFIVNDPFAGGTHLPDVTVVAPWFAPDHLAASPATRSTDQRVASDAAKWDGKPARFFVANRAHHADVGGLTPGSLPLSRTIDEEGFRIAPSRLTDELIDRFAGATRTPGERRGDLRAQRAAIDLGLQRLGELCDSHGVERIAAAGDALQDYAARFIRAIIAEMPDGEYETMDRLDDDGHDRTDIALRCTFTVTGEDATFDLTESDDQTPGPLNAVRAITQSAVMYALRCLAPTDIPSNSGVLRPVRIVTRPGSIVDARPPAAVAAGNVETSQRITDVVFAALALALPDRVPAASCGTMNNLTIGALPEDDGEPFAYYETIAGGAGAGPADDGGSAVQCHMTNTLNTPVEALEHSYPFRVEHYRVRAGSGGAGAQRGGDGVERAYRFLRAAQVTLMTERRRHGPPGAAGGGAGQAGEQVLIRADGRETVLAGKCSLRVEPGDRLVIRTPGGGGWGPVNTSGM